MIRKILSLSFLLLVAVTFVACKHRRTVDVNPGPAQIMFDESDINFGRQKAGERKIKREIAFYNTGSEPLVIHKVEPTCHCTVATFTQKPIRPGSSGEIEVELDLTGISGTFSRSLLVYANTAERIHRLVIYGEVFSDDDDQ